MTQVLRFEGKGNVWRVNPAFLVVCVVSFGWFTFWLHGQPFWDDDYARWLIPSMTTPFVRLLAGIFAPYPESWGFLDRPVIMFFFKAGYVLFGPTPQWFYLVKSVTGALLSGFIFLFARLWTTADSHPTNKGILLLPSALLVSAHPTFMSMLWLCDMEVLSQLCVVLSLYFYVLYRKQGMHKCPLSFRTVLFQAVIFIPAFVGYKVKASAKIVPLVILVHLLCSDRKALLHFLPLLFSLTVVNIPWLTLSVHPFPEFFLRVGPSTPTYYWRRPNFASFGNLFIGDYLKSWSVTGTVKRPYGLLQTLYPFGMAALALSLVPIVRRRRFKERTSEGRAALSVDPNRDIRRLVVVWFLLSIAVLAIYPLSTDTFISRYLLGVLVPGCILLGRVVYCALLRYEYSMIYRSLILVAVCCQIIAGLHQTQLSKRSTGYGLVLIDKVRKHLEENYADANIVYNGVGLYSYWPGNNGNTYYVMSELDEPTFEQLVSCSPEVPLILVQREKIDLPGWKLVSEIGVDKGAWNNLLPPLKSVSRVRIYGLDN